MTSILIVCAIVIFLWLMITWPEKPQPALKDMPVRKLVLPPQAEIPAWQPPDQPAWEERELEPPAVDLGGFARQPNHCEPFSTEEFNKYLDALYDPKNKHQIEE